MFELEKMSIDEVVDHIVALNHNGAVNLRFDHLQDIAEPFELRFPFYRIGWLP
jgi:hypothetical protein